MRITASWRSQAFTLVILTGVGLSQSGPTRQSLSVNGRSGSATIYRIDGKSYVDLESLVRISGGSVSFQGEQMILRIPVSEQATPDTEPPPSINSDLSQNFMREAVQTLAILKEWTSTLAYGIQRGVPGDGSRIVLFHDRAAEAMRLAQIAASTSGDQDALQLLTNHFNLVSSWSDKLVGERRRMDTGKYSMSQDALKNDETFQTIDACSKFLNSMLPNGAFQDNYACH